MKLYDHSRVIFTHDPEKEGYIEIRREVLALSMGRYNFVQGRIALDNGKYIRGCFGYSDDIPDGYDIRVNFSDQTDLDLCKLNLESDHPFGHPIDRSLVYDDINQLDNGCIYSVKPKMEWMERSNDYRKTALKVIGRKPWRY